MNGKRQILSMNAKLLCRFLNRNQFCTTVDRQEIDKFSNLADEWWNETGPMKALHSMNRVRIPWIQRVLLNKKPKEILAEPESFPLTNLKIADIGCGAGILCEPLARLGALVVGIDASDENIKIADSHLRKVTEFYKNRKTTSLDRNLKYFSLSVEDFASKNENEEKFDAVVASEILEHVSDCEIFLKNCVKLLKPDGVLFVTTLNRTILSKFLAIYVAENLLNLVPKGIHDWQKFVPPDEVEFLLERENCSVKLINGLCYNPLTSNWSWIRDTSVNYGLHAVKNS